MRPLRKYRRITVKIGSALLVDRADRPEARMAGLARRRCCRAGLGRRRNPRRVVGRDRARPHHPRPRQARAEARGEPGRRRGRPDRARRRLVGGAWPQGPEVRPDPAHARRHRGAPALPQRPRHDRHAAQDGRVPVINENDTVATSEIRYGDNDRLAARVATMMGGDLLVLLSDIDGLYTAPPRIRSRRRIPSGRRTHHARDRGYGGRSGLRTVARRHAHKTRRRQDRHHRRHGDDHHLRRASEPADRDRARRAFYAVPAEPHAGQGLQELDRRPARTGRAG